jgi:DNA-binding transcriptional LysR family regulator
MAAIDLNDVEFFVQVVERGGFAIVGREAGVPTSTVSRAVSRLEQALGVRLMHRTTRAMQPTDDGRSFYAKVAPAVASMHDATRELEAAGKAPHGVLRVSAPGDVGTSVLPRMLLDFTERCPNVRVELDLTPRKVNLIEDGFDMAVRAGPLADSGLAARKLLDVALTLFASADYLQRYGAPTSVTALEQHRCVLFQPRDGKNTWQLEGPGGDKSRITVTGQIGGNDFSFVRAAAAAGAGIALLPQIFAEVLPLLPVLPGYSQRGAALYVVHPSSRQVPAKVAAFRDFLVEAFARLAAAQAPAAISRSPRRKRAQ